MTMTFSTLDLFIFLAGIGLGLVLAFRGATAVRLTHLERKVDLLLNHLGVTGNNTPINAVTVAPIGSTYSGSTTGDVVDLVRRGKKIEAVKVYREQNPGTNLLGAKNAVEQIERNEL